MKYSLDILRSCRAFFCRLINYPRNLMSALTDLQAAIVANTAAVDAAVAILSAPPSDDTAALIAATGTLTNDAARLAAAAAPK